MYIKRSDERGFAVLNQVLYALAYQLAEIWFRHIPHPETRKRMGQRRGKALAEASYLRRLELPVYRSERRGAAPFIYTLGPRAVPHLAHHLGVDPGAIAWRSPPSDERKLLASPTHALQLTDYYLALTRSCEESNTTLLTWKGELELNREPLKVTIPTDRGKTEPAVFRADAYYELGFATQKACLFHEHDRGGEPIVAQKRRTHWRRKIRCYLALMESGQLSDRLGIQKLWVTIVTTAGEGRVANIKAQVEELAGRHNHSFWMTTFDHIQAVRPGKDDPSAINILRAPIWHVSGVKGLQSIL